MSDCIMRFSIPSNIFSTTLDEEAFFFWLYSIPGYHTCKGVGDTIYIDFSDMKLEDTSLRELVGLLRRYNIPDLKCLKVFENSQFGPEFRSTEEDWHSDIFG